MEIKLKKIMCAIDFSESTDMVLDYGKVLADEFHSKLCICHIVSSPYMIPNYLPAYADYSEIEKEYIRQAEEMIKKMTERVDLEYEIFISSGYPADEITQFAKDNNADLVIAATCGGSGIKRFIVGSVTDRLVKILHCPLLVLNPSESAQIPLLENRKKFSRILVGTDFSEGSGNAFDYALRLARKFEAKLYLAHVVRPADPRGLGSEESINTRYQYYPAWNMADYMGFKGAEKIWEHQRKKSIFKKLDNQLLSMLPEDCRNWCTPVTVVLKGDPYKELTAYAEGEKIDMIVLGIHGHTLFETLLVGSTTERVISRAPCPVLAIRSPDDTPHREQKGEPFQDSKQESLITARDIMEKNVITVSAETDILNAVNIFIEKKINGLPVVDKDKNLKGILCQSDLIFKQKKADKEPVISMFDNIVSLSSIKQWNKDLNKIEAVTVEQAMTENPVTAEPDTPVSEIAALMVDKHFHTLPVVKDKKLIGVIGKEDMLRVLLD